MSHKIIAQCDMKGIKKNLGIKNGHLAVIDLGDTLGGTPEGKQVTLNLENIKIRPLTEKHIRKQLLLV